MTEDTFNIQTACNELKINKEIYLRIVLRAVEQTTTDIAALGQAHQVDDVTAIQAIAHRLKGDYANLRVERLTALAK